MFVKTIKVKKPGFVILALAAAIFAAVLMILVLTGAGKGSEYTMKTEADRQAFLKEEKPLRSILTRLRIIRDMRKILYALLWCITMYL